MLETKILRVRDNSEIKCFIEEISLIETQDLIKNNRFQFDWTKQVGRLIYKIQIIETGLVVGLMSILDRPIDQTIQIMLLESSVENVGREKEYTNIAGVLLAFACREAFKKGYNGCICLIPKTNLIKHYQSIYKMNFTGFYLFVDGRVSFDIINKYLGI